MTSSSFVTTAVGKAASSVQREATGAGGATGLSKPLIAYDRSHFHISIATLVLKVNNTQQSERKKRREGEKERK